MNGCRSSLNCIVPPYMLREIINNGTQQQSQQALRTIVSAEAIRVQREIISKEGPPEAILEAGAGGLNRIVYSADNGGSLPGREVRTEGGPPTGDPALVAGCPAEEKRLVRFVGEGDPKTGATVFVTCTGD